MSETQEIFRKLTGILPSAIRRRGIRFLLVGAGTNIALICYFWILTKIGVNYFIAMTSAYIIGVLTGFTLNKRWSWQNEGGIPSTLVKYVAVYVTMYFVQSAIVIFLVEVLELDPFWSILFAAICVVTPMFILIDRFVFDKNSRPD